MTFGRVQPMVLVAGLALAAGCSPGSDGGDRGGSTQGTAKPPVASAAAIEEGRALYKAHCAACHGETGKGDGPAAGVMKPPPQDHTDRAYMSTHSDKQIADIIRMGGAIKGKPLMPSHPQFKEPQLQALVAFVRSLSAPAGAK